MLLHNLLGDLHRTDSGNGLMTLLPYGLAASLPTFTLTNRFVKFQRDTYHYWPNSANCARYTSAPAT